MEEINFSHKSLLNLQNKYKARQKKILFKIIFKLTINYFLKKFYEDLRKLLQKSP